MRTTIEDVGNIIEVDEAIGLTPFITIANELVTECCTNLTVDYTEARLVLIETWLAAHFYTVRDMRVEQERAGSVSEKFQSKVDLGFDTSHYGQTAMRLDTAGGLALLNEKIKSGKVRTPSVSYIGTTKKESEE